MLLITQIAVLILFLPRFVNKPDFLVKSVLITASIIFSLFKPVSHFLTLSHFPKPHRGFVRALDSAFPCHVDSH